MLESELLKKALEDGIIDIPTICEKVLMSEKKKLLAMHQEKIWLASDGRYKTHLPDKKRRVISKPTRKELEDYLVEYYRELSNEPTFEDLYNEWINKKLSHGEIQLQSKLRYDNTYNKFIKNSILDIKIKEIDELLLEDFVFTTIKDFNLKSKAWSDVRTVIRGVFKYAKKKGCTDISISQFFGDLEISKKVFKPNHMIDKDQVFTAEEVSKLIKRAYSSNRIQELAVVLALQTGMRAGEIVSLRWSDVSENYIEVSRTEIRTRDEVGKQIYVVRDSPKTENGFRKVYFTDEVKLTIKKIRAINPFSEYIFVHNGNRLHAQLLGYTSKAMCEKIGIKPRSIHKCRKTYATNLINANVDEKLIQSQLGHSDIATTKKYYYYNNISEKDALDQLKRVTSLF